MSRQPDTVGEFQIQQFQQLPIGGSRQKGVSSARRGDTLAELENWQVAALIARTAEHARLIFKRQNVLSEYVIVMPFCESLRKKTRARLS